MSSSPCSTPDRRMTSTFVVGLRDRRESRCARRLFVFNGGSPEEISTDRIDVLAREPSTAPCPLILRANEGSRHRVGWPGAHHDIAQAATQSRWPP